MPHTVGSHLAQRIGQQRVPVAIAPVDRQLQPGPLKFMLGRPDQIAILLIDGTHPAKAVIVLGHFGLSCRRNIASAKHIIEKRQDIAGTFGASERHDHQSIKWGSRVHERFTCRPPCGDGRHVGEKKSARRK